MKPGVSFSDHRINSGLPEIQGRGCGISYTPAPCSRATGFCRMQLSSSCCGCILKLCKVYSYTLQFKVQTSLFHKGKKKNQEHYLAVCRKDMKGNLLPRPYLQHFLHNFHYLLEKSLLQEKILRQTLEGRWEPH